MIEQATPEREQAILDAVAAGRHEHFWTPIRTYARGQSARVWVSADALKVDGTRVTTNAETCQRIADLLDASLCTTRICDIAWEQADIRIPPQLQTPDAHMSDWSRTVQHSLAIDRLITAGYLARNVGKNWVLSDRLVAGVAANYGWFVEGNPKGSHESWSGLRLWQPLGTAHNTKHVDYSQTVTLMRNDLEVNGILRRMDDIMRDPELSWLVNDDGIMRVRRLPGPKEAPPPMGTEIKFIRARNYTKGRIKPIGLVVLHSMEAAEKPTTAESVAQWFAGVSAPKASAHYCIDNDSIVQCVLESDTAWHAPGSNADGIGLEHAGYARQSEAEWADEFSTAMLARSAHLCADICERHSIPVEYVDAAGLLAGKRGITTHAEVSKAFKRSTHTDPGLHFPMSAYLDLVRA